MPQDTQASKANTTRPFSFGPANPVSGRRGIDYNARMWIAIDWASALRQCLIEDRRWNPVDFAGAAA